MKTKENQEMKRLITVIFATIMAVTLSAPAWSQSAGAKTQTKAAASNTAKEEKKEAKAKAKAEKKAKKAPKAKK